MVAAILWDIKTHTKGSTVWKTWSHFQEFPPKRGHFSTLDVFFLGLKIEKKKLLEKGRSIPGFPPKTEQGLVINVLNGSKANSIMIGFQTDPQYVGEPRAIWNRILWVCWALADSDDVCILSFNVLCVYIYVSCLFLLEFVDVSKKF